MRKIINIFSILLLSLTSGIFNAAIAQIQWIEFSDTVQIQCNAYDYVYLEDILSESFIADSPGCNPVEIEILEREYYADVACVGNYEIVIGLTDACSNDWEDFFVISVIDTSDFSLEEAFPNGELVLECGEEIIDTIDPNILQGSCYPFFDVIEIVYSEQACHEIIEREYNVYDICEQIVYTSHTFINIIDEEPPQYIGNPELYLPDDITMQIEDCNGSFSFSDNFFYNANGQDWDAFPLIEGIHFEDNCSASFSLIGPPPNEEFPIGITTVEYLIQDECGFTLSHKFTVTIECTACGEGYYACEESCEAPQLCHYDNCTVMEEGIKGCTGQWTGIEAEWPALLCNGLNMASNMSWISFEANTTAYDVYVTPVSCNYPNGEGGLVSGIYDFCREDDGECIGGGIECIEFPESINYSVSDLISGNTYFLFVNGCNGTECDYIVQLIPREDFTNNDPYFDCVEGAGKVAISYYCDENNDGVYSDGEELVALSKPTISTNPPPLAAGNYGLDYIEWLRLSLDSTYYFEQINNDIELIGVPDSIRLDSTNGFEQLYIKIDKEIQDTLIQELSLSPHFTERCDRVVPFTIELENSGTIDFGRNIVLEFDNHLMLQNYDTDPIAEEGNKATWSFESIAGTNEKIIAYIRMPSVQFRGEIFCLKLYFENDRSSLVEYCFELRCSYDPNDKHGTPFRGGHNFVTFDEDLIYTIRFENLGNDTAFNVRIEDALSEYLDYNSFKFLQSSHELSNYFIDWWGNLTFFFNDIGLPGITQDSIGNKGFVQYKINSRNDIQLKTEIQNKASIYFDSNPPVVTNTTSHIMVDELPDSYLDVDQDGYFGYEECDDNNALINPEAIEIPNNDIDEDCDGEALIIDEDNDGFNSDEDCDDLNASINPDAIEIPNNDIDEDCDGEALIIDEDNDGFNSDEDCDDLNASINPDAIEIPNNDIDEDCDGEALIIDEDNDGFNSDEDCDDLNPLINPDAIEIPNNDIDEDCDGEALIIDEDNDGFNSDEDCDDLNASINPDAIEIPNNNIDEDCDGEALIIDEDNDGFNSDEDCDDLNPLINPDAIEIPNNGIDEDCDGEDLITTSTDERIEKIRIYPNPFQDMITLSINNTMGLRYKLYDTAGKIISTGEVESELRFPELHSGIYILKILDDNNGKVQAFKLVKT